MLNPRKEHETTYTTTSDKQGYKTTRLRWRTGDFFLQTKAREEREDTKMKEKPSVGETSRTEQHGTAQRLALRLGPSRPRRGQKKRREWRESEVGGREGKRD